MKIGGRNQEKVSQRRLVHLGQHNAEYGEKDGPTRVLNVLKVLFYYRLNDKSVNPKETTQLK